MATPGIKFSNVSSKASHIYKRMYPWKSKFELASHLCRNIVHNGDGVVAINKPFGVGLRAFTEEMGTKRQTTPTNLLATHGGGSQYSIEDVLPLVRDELKLPQLAVVKTSDKYNSGVMLLAENPDAGKKIRKSLAHAKDWKIYKYIYHIVSPHCPYEGLHGQVHAERVGIMMQKNPNHKFAQPVIVRDFSTNSVKRRDVDPARLEFRVLSEGADKSSLVEISCNDTKRSLLRIYCADMLMPILGDHLYSSRIVLIHGIATRLKPLHAVPGSSSQKLPPQIQGALGLGPTEDTKIVPVHAHLYRLTLAHYAGKDNNLVITAPHPDYFKWTCSTLKLSLPN